MFGNTNEPTIKVPRSDTIKHQGPAARRSIRTEPVYNFTKPYIADRYPR